ncbi:hypothetical protein BGP_5971 [Beggiatoa sp. PS]|nr:hypothetical protein BGP_5971 [Beggiatoa sp. PS]
MGQLDHLRQQLDKELENLKSYNKKAKYFNYWRNWSWKKFSCQFVFWKRYSSNWYRKTYYPKYASL